jgi:hypothetical protein
MMLVLWQAPLQSFQHIRRGWLSTVCFGIQLNFDWRFLLLSYTSSWYVSNVLKWTRSYQSLIIQPLE